MVPSLESEWPRITVITPCLNHGEFLEQCFDSIHGQAYPNLEHIVKDGGSTDDSVAIIQRHQYLLHHWTSSPDGGAAAAINDGFKHSTGELVTWLNADDFYIGNAFEEIARLHRANPTSPFLFGNGVRVDRAGTSRGRFFPENRVLFNREALTQGLDYILQPSTFVNRRFVRREHLLDPALQWGFDWELWLYLAQFGEPATTQSVLAASREYASTLTATGGFKRAEELRRIAEAYSGSAITVGSLTYYVDTLRRSITASPERLSRLSIEAVDTFWLELRKCYLALWADGDGFPLPHYPIGTLLDFSSLDTCRSFLQTGWWSDPEPFGIWSLGERSEIIIRADPPAGDIELIFFMRPLVGPSVFKQVVRVFVNDIAVGEAALTDPAGSEVTARVPHAVWCASYPVRVALLLPDACVPREVGLGEDWRTLGVNLARLLVTEVPRPASCEAPSPLTGPS